MWSSKSLAVVIVAALVLGSVGFFLGTLTNTQVLVSGAESGQKSTKSILIGATVSKTGVYSPVVGVLDKFYKNWEEAINERGGLYVKEQGKRLPVKFVIYDDQSDPANVVRLYERLIGEDKVDLLLGPFGSPLSLPLVPVITRSQVPTIIPTAGAPPIWNQGSDWIFQPIDLITEWSKAYFEMQKAIGKARTIAIVATDEPFGRGVLTGAKKYVPQAGLQIVEETISPVGTKDFTPVIIRLKEKNPDIVFLAMSVATDAATLVKQSIEQGLKPREFHVTQLLKAFVEAVGTDKANYMTGVWYWSEDLPYGGVWGREFVKDLYQKTAITHFDFPWVINHFHALEVAAAAIEKAGSLDKNRLREALRDLYVLSTAGLVYFRSFDVFKGVGTLVPFPVQIQDGKFVVIWPKEVKAGDYNYPSPK